MPFCPGAAQNVFPKRAVPVTARAPVFTKVLLLQFIVQFLKGYSFRRHAADPELTALFRILKYKAI